MIIPTSLLRIVSCTQPNPPTELQNPQGYNRLAFLRNQFMRNHITALEAANQNLKKRNEVLELLHEKTNVELARAYIAVDTIIENTRIYRCSQQEIAGELSNYIKLLFPFEESLLPKIPMFYNYNMFDKELQTAIQNDYNHIKQFNENFSTNISKKSEQHSGTLNQSSKSDLQSAQQSSENKGGGSKRKRATKTSSEDKERFKNKTNN